MIYIYRAIETDFYKIGYTSKKDPDERRKQWETGCPYSLELVGTMQGGLRDESRLHSRLKRKGKWKKEAAGQEWFQLTEEEAKEILERGARTPARPRQHPNQRTMAWIKLNLGKKRLPTRQDAINLVCQLGGIESEDCGEVVVRSRSCRVEVREDMAHDIVKALNGQRLSRVVVRATLVR